MHLNYLVIFPMLFAGFHLNAQGKADKKLAQLIGLSNAVVKLSNFYTDKYPEYESVLNTGRKLYEQLKSNGNPRSPLIFDSPGAFPADPGMYVEYEEAMATVSNKTKEKENLASAVKTAKAQVDRLEKWGKNMKRYFESNTFETDGLAAYFTINDSLEYYLWETRKSWKLAAGIASGIGEEAEIKLLKDKPFAQFIIPMKNDMKSSRNILSDLSDLAASDKPNYALLKDNVATFQTYLSRHKDLSGKDASILSHVSYFINYYTQMEQWTNILATLLDELLLPNRNIDRINALYRDLYRCHDEAVDNYNNFVINTRQH
ncbi:MAG: hypothetical protein LBC40_02165 [Dysgonamonadaceae bacterium]|jgi:hypothetical protein|nr:hypothetical protein [Dysgonamonadaceae bacterium]